MDHTAGFEERVIGTAARTAEDMPEFGEILAEDMPERIRPPGEVSGYSNYGAALAGYVVARVSGEPYERYVERHVFDLLGMGRSTAAQPVPEDLAEDLARSYDSDEDPPGVIPFAFDNRLPFLAVLADVHRLRYERDGTLEALDRQLETTREVLDLYPSGHPVATTTLYNLGLMHWDRFHFTDDVADLDNAAHCLRLAADRATDPDIRMSAEDTLSEIAALRGPTPEVRIPPDAELITSPGVVIPPDKEFDAGAGAVLVTGPDTDDGLAELIRHHNTLTVLLERYEHTGDPRLLDRICGHGHAALAELPSDHPQRWLITIPLGPALMRRFETHGDPADLDEAIELLREALARPTLSPAHLTGDPGVSFAETFYRWSYRRLVGGRPSRNRRRGSVARMATRAVAWLTWQLASAGVMGCWRTALPFSRSLTRQRSGSRSSSLTLSAAASACGSVRRRSRSASKTASLPLMRTARSVPRASGGVDPAFSPDDAESCACDHVGPCACDSLSDAPVRLRICGVSWALYVPGLQPRG